MGGTELGNDFVKLTEKNYLKWESKMKIKLAKFELMEYISEAYGEETLSNGKAEVKMKDLTPEDKKHSQKTVAIMLEGMSDSLQIEYLDVVNATRL